MNWDFKVAIFFDIEYLRNDTKQSQIYYKTPIENYKLSVEW